MKAEPDKTIKQEVVEEQTRVDQIALTNSADETVRFFLRAARVAGRLVQRVDYDGARGTVAITFRDNPSQVLAEELPPKEHHT